MNVLLVVEDDADLRFLVRLQFDRDPDFVLDGEAADAESAVALSRLHAPDLIVLDHWLGSGMTGLDAAPVLNKATPRSRIVLFSASEEVRIPADESPAVDAFLLKTQIDELLPLCRRLLGLPLL